MNRIAAVPFTRKNRKKDLEDLGSNFDGAPGLEFRHAGKALGLEQSGLSYQRIPPDARFPYGHTHSGLTSARWGKPPPAHAVRKATVGGIRDARTAGIRPANAPIRMAEAMPPDHASTGITTAQPFELA